MIECHFEGSVFSVQRFRQRPITCAVVDGAQLLVVLVSIRYPDGAATPVWIFAKCTNPYLVIRTGHECRRLEYHRRFADAGIRIEINEWALILMYIIFRITIHTFCSRNRREGDDAVRAFRRTVDHSRLVLYPHERVIQHDKVARF